MKTALDIADPQQMRNVIDSLVERDCIIATSERIFLSPDDVCLTAALKEAPTPRFSMSDIARTEAVVCYADRSGVAVD